MTSTAPHPHARAHAANRAVAALLAVVVVVATLALAGPARAQGGDAGDYVARINALRASRGLPALQVDGNLTSLAQAWSQQMASTGGLSHAPNLAAGVTANWTDLGENVGTGGSNDAVWNAFLNSAPHMANLLSPKYTHVGVGVVWVGDRQFTTHRFMGVAGAGGGGTPAPGPPAVIVTSPPPATSTVPAPTTAPPPTPAPAAAPAEAAPTTTPPPAEPERVAAMLLALRGATG